MTTSEIMGTVKNNLGIQDDKSDLLISDVILMVCDYCNLEPDCIPDILEGTGYNPEIASIKEGDGGITWAQTEGNTKASIYGLSENDKASLRRHRRLRGYAKPVCKTV